MTYLCIPYHAPVTDEIAAEIEADVDNEMNWCCAGSAMFGPTRCTCWKTVYSIRRRKPIENIEPVARKSPCEDCAYRPDSAEQQDERADHMAAITHGDNPFWCHQGMAYQMRYLHPSGMVVEAPRDEVGAINTWDPRMIDSVPYKASGRPANMCAGWALRHARVKQ